MIEAEEIIQAYRTVFDTSTGQQVLGHMLTELHFFDEIISSEEERVLANYGRKLLNRMGIWNAWNIDEIMRALCRIQPPGQEGQTRQE